MIPTEVTIKGLKRGFHVSCEKPPGRDMADITRVIEQERVSPGLKLMYGFNHRFHDSTTDALDILNSGS